MVEPAPWPIVVAIAVLAFLAGSLFEYAVTSSWETGDPMAYEMGYSAGYDSGYHDAESYEPWFVRLCLGEGGFATCLVVPLLVAFGLFAFGLATGISQKTGAAKMQEEHP